MATLRFLLKRFVAQRLLGLAVVITLAFTVGVLVAGPIYADAAREAILSSTLAQASVTVANARFQVFGGSEFDWPHADAAVEADTRSLPLGSLVRQGLSTVRLGGDAGPSVPLLFRDGAGRRLRFHGDPPGPGGIALETGVTQPPGLRIGDPVSIVGPTGERMRLTLTGRFDPPKADDFWFGSHTPFPAPDSTSPPPALVARDTMLQATKRLGLTTQFVWDAYLSLRGVPFTEARLIPGRLNDIADRLNSQPGLDELRVSSGLATLMEIVDQRVQNLRIPILLVVFQIGAVTLAVLAGVGALTLTRQAFELSVLHSRGFSRRTLLAAQAVQAGLAAVVAYPLGLLFGLVLARLASHSNGPSLPGTLFPVHASVAAEVLGLTAAAAGAAILLLLSLPYVARTVLEERRVVSREERPILARLPVELIVLPVGLFAFVQLRGDAAPSGNGTIDPLVLLAPTLLLFAASFIALRALLFGFRRIDRRVARTRRLSVYLAGRRLGRAPGTGFAAALLLLLSMGLLVVSTSYRAIVLRNHADSAHTQIGADWQLQVTPPANVIGAIRHLGPESTAVVRTEPDLPQGGFALPPVALAVDPGTYLRGGWWRDDYSDTPIEDILARLRTPQFGLPLTGEASTLRLVLDVAKPPPGVGLTATVQEASGATSTPPPRPLAAGRRTYDIPIAGGARLLSISFDARSTIDLPSKISVAIESANVDGEPIALQGWQPLAWRGGTGKLTSEGPGFVYRFAPGVGDVIGGIEPSAPALPALVSPSVASTQGSRFTATLGGQELELEQIGVASQFPSTVPNSPFVVISAPALLEREAAVPDVGLTLNEIWSMGSLDPRPELVRLGFIPGLVQRAEPIEGILAQLPQSLAVGMNYTAAAGGLGLVIVGVGAGLYFAQRRRDFEFAALRAMGVERGQIRRTLVLEQTVLLGFAIVAGLGLGYLMLRLMMPYVGRSLGVSYPPPVLVIDWTSLGVSLGAIVLATGLGLGLAIRTLMRSSVTGVLRGEAE